MSTSPSQSGAGNAHVASAQRSSSICASCSSTGCTTRAGVREEHGQLLALRLKVQTLQKYKQNYELLCGQLAELNGQVGLQLQKHELDVQSLNGTIASLQRSNQELQAALDQCQAQLSTEQALHRQDQEYCDRIHRQLSAAAELLQTSEHHHEEKENELTSEIQALQKRIADDSKTLASLRSHNKRLQKELSGVQESGESVKATLTQKVNEWRKRYRRDKMEWKAQVQAFQEEIVTLRSANRRLSKQANQDTHEKARLTKQVTQLQDDVAHVTEMMEKMRTELHAQTKRAHRCKQQRDELQSLVQSKQQIVQKLEDQVLGAQQELIERNAIMDERHQKEQGLHAEISKYRQEAKEAKELVASLRKKLGSVERKVREKDDREKNAATADQGTRLRKELRRIKDLLKQNNDQTEASSKEVETLKREITSVQDMLQQYREQCDQVTRQHEEVDWSEDDPSLEEARQRVKVEKAVLVSAIDEQMRAMIA